MEDVVIKVLRDNSELNYVNGGTTWKKIMRRMITMRVDMTSSDMNKVVRIAGGRMTILEASSQRCPSSRVATIQKHT